MKTIKEIRSDNLQALRKAFSRKILQLIGQWEVSDRKGRKPKDTDAAFARSLGDMNPRLYSQLKNGKNMGPDVARKIEQSQGLEPGWMDHDNTPSVLSYIMGFLGAQEPIPSNHSPSRRGISFERIEETSLAPRIHAGEYIACLETDCDAGSDVLVELTNGQRLIKRLVYRRDDELAFEAVNGKGERLLCRLAEIGSMQLIVAILPFKHLPT